MFCRHCGSEVKDSAKFCRKCGSDIKRKTIDAEGNGQQGGPPQPPSSPPSQQPRQEPFPPPRQTVNQPPAHGGVAKKSNGRTVLLIILIIALVAGLCVNIFQFINGSHLFSGGSAQKGLATYQEVNPASVIKTEKWGYVPTDQVIVVFKDDVDKGTAQKVVDQMGGTVVGELEFINLYQIETGDKTESELNATLDAVFELEGVELAFPNMPAYGSDMAGEPCSPLNDPAYKDPANSHYNVIGMENAWKILKGSGVPLNKVTVGVLDEAFYTGSSEFDGKTKLSGDTTNDPAKEDSQIIDGGFTHGTMVAHVIGADSKNGGMVGVAGVLEENLHIHSKNVFDVNPHYTATQADTQDLTQITVPATGVAYTDKTLVYLKKMVDEGATVINCSFNFKPQNDNYEYIVKAYEKFFKKMQETNPNVVFVASAGNTGNADKSKGGLNGKNDCPAGIKLPNVVTVGAINNDGSRAEFSSFATGDAELTLSAPGVEMVVGTDENGQPVKASGTSFSAPQVTSAIALLQSINPKLNAEEIKDLLVKTAAPGVTTGEQSIPIPEGMGAGVLRVDQAVLQAINDLRSKENKSPYTMQELLDKSTVDLYAETGFREYTVRASVPDAEGSNVSLKIEVTGKCSIEEDTVQAVQVGEEAVWNLTIEDDSVFVRVVRTDTEGCAFMTLKIYESVSGIYEVKGVWDSGDGPEPLTDWRAQVQDTGDGEMTITFFNALGTVLTGSYDEITGVFVGIDRNEPADFFAFNWWMGDNTTITFDFDSMPMTAKGTLTYDWHATVTAEDSDSDPIDVYLGPPTKVDFEMLKVEELPQ